MAKKIVTLADAHEAALDKVAKLIEEQIKELTREMKSAAKVSDYFGAAVQQEHILCLRDVLTQLELIEPLED